MKRPPPHPTPELIRAARKAAGLTQLEAATLVHLGAGQRWAEYESGRKAMDFYRMELFAIKTGMHPYYEAVPNEPENI